MLTAFTVENYRSFADKTTIELRPLTLLFGYNNSGKSALVRVLPLLADSMRPDATSPLYLASDAVREGGFGDLLSKLDDGTTIRFSLEYENQTTVDYEITRPTGSFKQSLISASISDPEDGLVRLDLIPGPQMSGAGAAYRLSKGGEETAIFVNNAFTGLVPLFPIPGTDRPDESISQVWDPCARIFKRLSGLSYELNRETLWLGSLRRHPDRTVQLRDGGALPRLRSDGSGVAQILALDRLAGGSVLSDVSAWYERGDCFKRRVDTIQFPDDRFSVVLEPLSAKRALQVNVADTGEGIAQVLPLLVAVAMARRGGPGGRPRLLGFEQPELHLHTAIHAPLAEHFSGLAATEHPPRMLIETHSENFLLGIQLQVAQRKLPHDRVLIYWVSQDDDGRSQIDRIELDAEGYASGFPDHVFDNDVDLARLLIKAREGGG